MIVIGAKLLLAPADRHSALDGMDFLGGVIHGAVENLLRLRAPDVATALGMGVTNRIKPYAILPPPFGWRPQQTDGERMLPLGVVLHGDAVRHAEAVAHTLTAWPEVRLAGRTDSVRSVELTIGHPYGSSARWAPGQPFPSTASLPPLDRFPARTGISIRFLTPLLLTGSEHRPTTTQERPPGLLRLVRALRRRIESADPALFARLADRDWISHEETVRPLAAQTPLWREVTWHYGSRTKNAPILFRGYLGTLHFQAPDSTPIPAPIRTLLQWGAWFGIGQRTALGQGMYLVEESTP